MTYRGALYIFFLILLNISCMILDLYKILIALHVLYKILIALFNNTLYTIKYKI